MKSLQDKNQRLLADLTSLGQVKKAYESRRTAVVISFLVLVIANAFFNLGKSYFILINIFLLIKCMLNWMIVE